MKRNRICILTLCLLLACTGSAFASANYVQTKYPAITDILLYENFLCELTRAGVDVTYSSPLTTMEYEDGIPYTISVYVPAEGIQFEIMYSGANPTQYSVYVAFIANKQALEQRALALIAFSLTFFENTWSDASQTIQSLTDASETDANGSRYGRLVRDDAVLGFMNENDYISLHYIIP